MKTILVGTDFSKASQNAINYAAEMALSIGAELVILNVYSIPVLTEKEMPSLTLSEIKKKNLATLKRYSVKLIKTHGKKLLVKYICRCGFVVDEIKNVAKEIMADIVVMGMQGSGNDTAKTNGSATTSLMAGSDCAVMCIDKDMKFSPFKKIVFASDLKEIENKSFSVLLSNLLVKFNAKLLILNVFKPHEVMPTISEAAEGLRLDKLMQDVKHSFNYTENEDVVLGITNFVKETKADLVVMIGRKHSLFHRLFTKPQTQRMAFHTNTPLLVLHT